MYDTDHISPAQRKFLSNLRKRKQLILLVQVFLLLFFFLFWEIAARRNWIDPFIFSQPSRMAEAAKEMLAEGILWQHTLATLSETIAGFLLGTIIGTASAVLLWWSPFVSAVAEPYLVVLNAIPKTALAPIIIVWFGNHQSSIILVALLTSVVVTILSVLNGFLQVDHEKIKLIRIFGGTKRQILSKVVFPANIPCILNALKINVGLSFVGVIVGEFLVAQKGLGFLIVYHSQTFQMKFVLMSILILAFLSAVMYLCISFIEKKAVKWQ